MASDARPVIEVIFATPTPHYRLCPVAGWRSESLDLAGADLSRLKAGTAPLVAGHRCGIEQHLGTIIDAWIDGDEAHARIRLSGRRAVRPLVRAILEGDLSAVSVGYYSLRAEPIAEGARDYIVKRWIPMEISICAAPADHRCRVLLP